MKKVLLLTLAAALAAALAACGGGDGGAAATAPGASQLTGVAATGAALANATVSVKDSAGTSACTETSIVTSGLGSYTCTLKAGETAPFFIVVTDPSGNTQPLVSIATTTPTPGTPLTVNATPLTTAIVAQLNNGDALGLANAHTVNVANLLAAKANVLAQLQAVLGALGVPANYDPFSTSITAATAGQTGNTADLVLDVVRITKDANGALALSTISDPTPVPLASATTTGNAVLAPPTALADLSKGAQLAAQAFNTCFALPVSTRVTLDSMQNITSVANECLSLVTTANVPVGAPAFKHNGYAAQDFFYDTLTSASMTNAKFSVPEIMAFYPLDNVTLLRDRAVINIRYLDNLGHAGNKITVAENFPGSSSTSRPSNWWMTGNQKNYDLSITNEVWRKEEFNPNPSNHFQTALRVWVESRSWAPQNAAVTSVHVTGPGYPTLGLWYGRTSYASGFVLMNERAATLPGTLTEACGGCVSYWIAQTQGLSGTAATTYKPNSGNSNWAQGTDGSYNGQNAASVARPKKGDLYTFEIYQGASKVATEKRTLLTEMVDVTQLVNLQWNDIGPASRAALNPANTSLSGVQTSLAIDWVLNPAAEFVQYAWISQTNGGSDNTTPFALGATSVVATPSNGSTFTALNVPLVEGPSTYAGYRLIGFNYRMLDGSTKAAAYQYWP